MKKIKLLLLGFAIVFSTTFLLPSCGLFMPVALYEDVTLTSGTLATRLDASTFTKEGKAESQNILGIINTGDHSVTAAMKAGGLTKVHHVDVQILNYLGIYAKHITIVYGE